MKKLVQIICSIVAVLALSTISVQASIKAPDRTSETVWYEDYAGVLSSDTKSLIQTKSQLLADKFGACIEVVTVDYVTGTIEDYALAIFNQWQLGSADNNNGVLILISIGDDDYRMVEGRGLEDSFGVDTMKDLLDEYLEPAFAAKDYDTGVASVFLATYDYLTDNVFVTTPVIDPSTGDDDGWVSEPVERPSSSGTRFSVFASLFGLIFVIIAVSVIVAIFKAIFGTRRQRTMYYNRPRSDVWLWGQPQHRSNYDSHSSSHNYYGSSSNFGSHSSSGSFGSHSSSGSFGGSHSSSGSFGGGHSSSGGTSHGGGSRGAGAGRH